MSMKGPAARPLPPGWLIQEWSAWLANVRRCRPATVRHRRYQLARFAAAHPDPWAVDADDVGLYLIGKADETAKNDLAAIRSWYRWAAIRRLGPDGFDPTVGIEVRVPRAEARPCPDDVWRAAIESTDSGTALMIDIAARCGLRRSEVAAVHTGDVQGRYLRVEGKGGVVRMVLLPDGFGARITNRPAGYLFPGEHGGHLTADAVGRRISHALPDGWTAHTLRHRYATRAWEASGDLILVQRMLGHSSPTTTQRYIGAVSTERERALAVAMAL